VRPELRPVTIAQLALALLAGLALAGCQEKKKAEVQGTAGGEVLPGSVSDAMLPIDTIRSQPPLAPKSDASGAKSDKSDAPDKPKAARPTRQPEADPQPRETPESAPAADE
jgi:hypothetical protein